MEVTGAALAMARTVSRLSHYWEHTFWGSVASLCWMPAQTQACATLSHLICSMCCLGDGEGVWGQDRGQWWHRGSEHRQWTSSRTLGALLTTCASVAEITSTSDWGELGSDQFLLPCHCLLSFLLVGEIHGLVSGLSLTEVSGELTAQVASGMQCCWCCPWGWTLSHVKYHENCSCSSV